MPPNQPPPARKRPTSSQPPVAGASRSAAQPPRRAVPESKLVCTAGPKAGTEFPLAGDEDIVIGRATENAISIPDTSVSRRHVQLRRVPDGWAASDMGSGNGTMVNGERIAEETILRNGDQITIGDTVLAFQDLTDTERRPAPARRMSNPGMASAAPLARRSSVPGRPSLAGRPDVRARLSRGGAPADPEAAKKKKRLFILGGAVVGVFLLALVGVKVAKIRKDRQEEEAQQGVQAQRHELSGIFQDAKNLVREGRWGEAKEKLEEVKRRAPNYPGVDDYLQRAEKEIPNEKALSAAKAALEKGDIPAAATAISKVSADTQQFQKLGALQQDLESRMSKLMTDAQVALGNNEVDKVKELTDTILKVQPNNRDAKVMNEDAAKAIELRNAPVVQKAGPAPKPWVPGVERYKEGDVTGALALEDECARKVAKCKVFAAKMREFWDMYKKVEELDAHGLQKLLAVDKEITEGPHSKLARGAGIKLATSLCKSASAAKAAGQYARAGELATRALQADPGDNCATAMLSDLKTKAHDLYMQAYSLKDQDPDQAVEKFKQVLQMTSPESEDHQKSQKWVNELKGQ